ncbi:Fusaric acid resistance protein-like-domain-containing protein [Calycina marina]|uniref:Fusaric acid resistance protein-like-domain-containing protein n=1 Tax=Calycina marina TaxID=1763456 RepID=A0A9P8CDY5_9HELO|nr:Fusaric acid resistance protein-like-domain-containing protein [Calycina marina]
MCLGIPSGVTLYIRALLSSDPRRARCTLLLSQAIRNLEITANFSQGKHLVATAVVYFHPARSAESMRKAVICGVLAWLYSAFISISSMWISVLFDTQLDVPKVGHAIIVVVFCGGGLGFIGFVKEKMKDPLVGVSCSLTSIAIITVLTKENAIIDGVFTNDKVVQVMKEVAIGAMISLSINYLALAAQLPKPKPPPHDHAPPELASESEQDPELQPLLGKPPKPRFYKRDDVRYGMKVGIGAALWAMFAFIPETRPTYQHWRGEWGLVSYMLVCSNSISASRDVGLQRLVGTLLGAALSVVAWYISGGEPISLASLGCVAVTFCFWIMLKKNLPPFGRFTVLTYNVSVLYAYSLSIRDSQDDEDEGGVNPDILSIVYHRCIIVGGGCIWGILITNLIFAKD